MKKMNIVINKNGIKFGIFIFLFMWIYFLLENIFPSLKYLIGIEPRVFSLRNIFALFLSWASHENIKHILNNSISIFALLFFICCFEKKAILNIFLMIFLTGIYVWTFGATNSIHIGVSGLVYSIFSFMLFSIIVFKKWIYLIPIIIYSFIYGINYLLSFMSGIIPQSGISFSGHFGGLIVGIFVSFISNKFIDKIK
jgi:membrane associated rhomboid family serine protease